MENLSFEMLPQAVATLTEKVSELTRLISEKQEQPKEEPETFLNIKETAEFLRVTIPTVYSKVSRGDLSVIKRNGRLYFAKSDLLAYLISGRVKSNEEVERETNEYLTKNKKGNGKY